MNRLQGNAAQIYCVSGVNIFPFIDVIILEWLGWLSVLFQVANGKTTLFGISDCSSPKCFYSIHTLILLKVDILEWSI